MTQVVSFSPEQKWANEAEDDDTKPTADAELCKLMIHI